MYTFPDLIKSFFTHKDFLPPKEQLPGTLFTPLHLIFAALLLAVIIFLAIRIAQKGERTIRIFFTCLWILLVILEPTKIIWETLTGASVNFEAGGILPLYPCSIFMYAMPFAIWGKEKVRYAACGYACSLGFLGAAINFVYPANILSNYSCLSFAGFHTFFYHGSMLLCALIMLISGYHSYKKAEKWYDLLLPSLCSFPLRFLDRQCGEFLGDSFRLHVLPPGFFHFRSHRTSHRRVAVGSDRLCLLSLHPCPALSALLFYESKEEGIKSCVKYFGESA